MIGIIQQVLLELLEEKGGEELKQRVLKRAHVEVSQTILKFSWLITS